MENRRWWTNYRGPFLIHAARGMSRQDFDDACNFAAGAGFALPHEVELREMLQFGGIVGRADLVGVVPPRGHLGRPETAFLVDRHRIDLRWHMTDQFGFLLSAVEPLPFQACRGTLNFFEVPTIA